MARTNAEQTRAPAVSVLSFGARGDGITDDTAAIQAGFDYVATARVGLFIPAGTYLISSPITHATGDLFAARPDNGIRVFGDGIGRTILQASETFSGHLINLDGNKDNISDNLNPVVQVSNSLSDLSIVGSGQFGANPLSSGLRLRANLRCDFRNIMIKEFSQYGLVIDGTTVPTKDDADTTSHCTFTNFHCHENNSHGVYAGNSRTSTLTFITCEFRNNTDDGLRMGYSGLRLINCSFAGNGQAGNGTGGFTTIMPATGAISRGLGLYGCESENNFNHEVRLDYCDGFEISGGRFGAYKNNVGATGQRVFKLGDKTGTSIVRGVVSGSQVANLGNPGAFGHTVFVFDCEDECVGLEVTRVGIGNNYTEFKTTSQAVVTKNGLGTSGLHSNPSFSITTIDGAPLLNKTGAGTTYSTESLFTSSSKITDHDNGSNIAVGTFTVPEDGYYHFGIQWGLTGFSTSADRVVVAISVNGGDIYPVHQGRLTGLGASDVIIVGGTTQLRLSANDAVVGLVTVFGETADSVDIDRSSPRPFRFYGRAF